MAAAAVVAVRAAAVRAAKAAAVAAASQQSHPSNKPPNGRVTPPFGASSSVSVTRPSCKSVDRILDKKNRKIGDERIVDVSSDYPEWKNSDCKDRKPKNRPIGDERILDVSSDYPEWKNSGCKGRKHTCLTDSEEWMAPLLYEAAMTRAQKEGEGVCTAHGAPTPYIDMLFFYPQVAIRVRNTPSAKGEHEVKKKDSNGILP